MRLGFQSGKDGKMGVGLKNRAADRVLKPTASAIYRSMVNNFHFAAVDPCRKYREGILLCSIHELERGGKTRKKEEMEKKW